MAWNYRSYGRSGGQIDPYACYHDAESILKFVIKDLGLKGKLGCYGRSMGGTMASHIANHYSEHIDFLFVDRSLGSLSKMAETVIAGTLNKSLYRCFSFGGWEINSYLDFLEAKCFKMLTQDPYDDTVDMFAALNTQVARAACEENIGKSKYASLKIEKTYNALRLLTKIETYLFRVIQEQSKLQKKNQMMKRRQIRQQAPDKQYDSSGYS